MQFDSRACFKGRTDVSHDATDTARRQNSTDISYYIPRLTPTRSSASSDWSVFRTDKRSIETWRRAASWQRTFLAVCDVCVVGGRKGGGGGEQKGCCDLSCSHLDGWNHSWTIVSVRRSGGARERGVRHRQRVNLGRTWTRGGLVVVVGGWGGDASPHDDMTPFADFV